MDRNEQKKKLILIVDDSEINRSLLSDILSDDFRILEAENGMEASVILHDREHEISLMLLDIVMPVMDGFELLAVMNKNGWIKSIPVIMISAENTPAYIDRAYDLGVLDYINRPFDERTVQRRVNSTILVTARQKELEAMVTDQIHEREKDSRLMIEILSNIVEFRNGESGLHVLHVQNLTELFLKKLLEKTDQYEVNAQDISLICKASALHDIGKIVVPEAVLNKPGRLTPEEFALMKTHSAEGAKLLSNIPMRENEPLIRFGYQICRWHHERYDGKGYPDGLKGEEIPIAAQVVALADVYDALTSKRVYKAAIPHEEAIQMILHGECGCFNPILMECLEELSDTLKNRAAILSVTDQAEMEFLGSVAQIAERGRVDVSDRTLRLLENERMKYKFLTDISQEIHFEYTVTPEILTLSARGAKRLDLPEILVNPKESEFATRVFGGDGFSDFLEKLRNSTPEEPVVEGTYALSIGGKQRWNKVIARSMWADGEPMIYEGAVGKIVDIHDDLEKINRQEAYVDPLTGAYNRRYCDNYLEGLPHDGIAMVDLDWFKRVNDTWGHQIGDEVLKALAQTILACIRSTDALVRYGGEEFVVAFQSIPPEAFAEKLENIRKEVEKIRIKGCDGLHVSVSIGGRHGMGRVSEMIGDADKMLYKAKVTRNSVKIQYEGKQEA